jgi:hypothetical protein
VGDEIFLDQTRFAVDQEQALFERRLGVVDDGDVPPVAELGAVEVQVPEGDPVGLAGQYLVGSRFRGRRRNVLESCLHAAVLARVRQRHRGTLNQNEEFSDNQRKTKGSETSIHLP